MTRISPLFLVLLSLGVFLYNLLTMTVHNRATGTLVVDESDHCLLSDPIIEMLEKERKLKKCQVAFPACSHLAVLMHGRGIHGYMIVSGLGKDGKDIDDVLLKLYLMHSHCLQNPLVYMMPTGIQRYFLKLEINTKLNFLLLVQNLIILGLQCPTDVATMAGTPYFFLLGLPIPIMWVTDEIENIGHEPLELHGAK